MSVLSRKLLAATAIFALLTAFSMPVFAGNDGGMLDNYSFEIGLSSWTISGKSGDKVVCTGDKNANDRSGLCGFLMKGNTDSRVRLKQKLSPADISDLNGVAQTTSMAVRAFAWRYSESALTKLTVKLIVKLDDGSVIVEKSTSSGITFPVRADWIQMDSASASVPQFSVFQSVTIKLIDKSNAGKQWVDDAEVNYVI
jgi:hypothetical protein